GPQRHGAGGGRGPPGEPRHSETAARARSIRLRRRTAARRVLCALRIRRAASGGPDRDGISAWPNAAYHPGQGDRAAPRYSQLPLGSERVSTSIMSQPAIITVAITGAIPRKADPPAVPVTPSEQIESTHEAFEAGASVVHIHVRNSDESPSSDPALFGRVQEGVSNHCPGMIIQFSTGG